MEYCPVCHEDVDVMTYFCAECGREMCNVCFGNPTYEVCRECRKKSQEKQKNQSAER